VFAAASLRDVATELGAAFEARHDTRVLFNFAGSNFLAQQIAATPKADLFLSADRRWVDFLESKGKTVAGSRRSFLSNKLVVIGHAKTELAFATATDLATAGYEHLALADPLAVPAGRYARSWLESVAHGSGTLWDAVSPRVTPTLDVRAALALVESDPRVIGIVYASDVLQSARARVLFEPDAAQQPAIVYGAVRIASGRSSELVQPFFDFLFSAEARDVYAKHGFIPPHDER